MFSVFAVLRLFAMYFVFAMFWENTVFGKTPSSLAA